MITSGSPLGDASRSSTAGTTRTLIANADDFGLSDGVNEGIVRAFTHGIVRSTSLMVRMPAAEAAAALSRAHPDLGVGLHLDIAEWKLENGEWVALYERVSGDDAEALEQETRAQLELFRQLMGRAPTHVDSHQHAHTREPLRSIVVDIVGSMGVPLRHVSGHSQYVGDFYGQDTDGSTIESRLSPAFLVDLIARLPEGVSELCCHPAARVDFGGMYANERIEELATLCDPAVLRAVAERNVALRSFRGS
jgi:chitin disaccharide deacetylase